MRFIYFSIPIAIFGLQMAWAGFRHPIEETGEQAAAVENTVIRRTVVGPATGGKSAQTAGVPKAANPASAAPNTYGPPAPVASGKSLPMDRHTATAPVPPPLTYPGMARQPNYGPIPKAGSLPEAAKVAAPGAVHLPNGQQVTISRDLMPVIEFKGKDRSARIHAYSRQARMMPVPQGEHTTEVRSRAIAEKYKAALSPVQHRPIRTPLQLQIDALAKITLPARPVEFRQMVKRIDALFEGLDQHYARGMVALWELSRSQLNPAERRARDSLFSGVLSQRAGWESVAATEFEASANEYLQDQERYVKVLWQQLEDFENPLNVDRVTKHFDSEAIEEIGALGDKANFSMAKAAMRRSDESSAKHFADLLQGHAIKDRYALLAAMSTLKPKEPASAETRATLEQLSSAGDLSVRDEARLALARALLRQGATVDALAYYRAIQKNGVNRLEVMSEQSYAEFLNGNHPEALGKAIGVESKFFQYGFSPDVHMVETLSRKANCDFGGAEASLQRFANRYVPELAALDKLNESKPDAMAYYNELISYHDTKEPMRYQRYFLRLPTVMENQKLLNQAETDLDHIDKVGIEHKLPERPEGWDRYAQAMRANWEKRAPALKKQAAEAALTEAVYQANRLRQDFAQAELMGLDLSTTAAKDYNMQNALNFPVRKIAATEPGKNQVLWPFEQEIWEDELDSIRMINPSKCALAGK